jgi:LemA protein
VTAIYVVIGVVALLIIAVIVSYNRFVRQRNLVQESWRQIDVELNRRHDLIPNLVETVRGYAAHERGVFEAVTQARAAAQSLQSGSAGPAAQGQAEGVLQQALGRLMAVVENYPQLKANEQFIALQQQLAETEDRIAAGRRFYNANVRALNTRVEAFPSAVIASMFHFEKAQYFEVEDAATRAPVQVDFSSITGSPSAGTVPGAPVAAPPDPGAAPPTPPLPGG